MRIAIVGAGPAGAMAAVRLARAGAQVMLFDPSHPREKPCGGGLTGRALALISDIIDIAALPAVVVKSAIVHSSPLDHAAVVGLVDRGLTCASSLVVLSRRIFDKALADAAAAAGGIFIPERVVDVSRRRSTMLVCTRKSEYACDVVLGADGASSLVRKKLSRPFLRSEMSVAAGFFAHGATASAITLEIMPQQPGYLWSFPRPDHLAVGVCTGAAQRISSNDLLAETRAWIDREVIDANVRLQPYAWPIPSIGFGGPDRLETAAGPGWMLLGDAAGLVDPLTREGIYYALLSGQWAAQTLACTSGKPEIVYLERLIDEIHPELHGAARLSGMFFSMAFSTLLVKALRQSSAVRQVFVDFVAGTQPYRGLRRRLLAAGDWKLAGRAALIALRSRVRTGIGVK